MLPGVAGGVGDLELHLFVGAELGAGDVRRVAKVVVGLIGDDGAEQGAGFQFFGPQGDGRGPAGDFTAAAAALTAGWEQGDPKLAAAGTAPEIECAASGENAT